jgi:4-diphosphocytidyl-2-C-methyl-D-erythritol kinase
LSQREVCPRVRLRAHAKINLTLEVLRKRPDEYHELRSVFQAVSLYDEISITVRDTATLLSSSGWPVPRDAGNLCILAAQVYLEATGFPPGMDIDLHKSIPIGGGLGGGSSDAAAVLRGLNYLAGDLLSEGDLRELAAGLGSDVPFFLGAGTALASGRGEKLSELYTQRLEWWGVVVQPGFQVSTGSAYKALDPATDFTDGAQTLAMWEALNSEAGLETVAKLTCNCFRRSLEAEHDEVRQLRAHVRRCGALTAELSGSGSCVYGIFEGEQDARTAARSFRTDGLWARVIQPALLGVEIVEAWTGDSN